MNNNALKIKFIFTWLKVCPTIFLFLCLSVLSASAQTLELFKCDTPLYGGHCYTSASSINDAGDQFCAAIYPGGYVSNYLPIGAKFVCHTNGNFIPRCSAARNFICESIPPSTSLEGYDYKPFDSSTGGGSCSCSCEGSEWTSTLSGNPVQGCLKPKPSKDFGCTGDNGAGNPCNVATGNKYQPETDFSSKGLSFTRSYNSQNLADLGLGKGWRNNHQKKFIVSSDALTQVSGTGRGESWTNTAGIWQGDADSDELITEDASGFQLTKASGVIELYNFTGQLLSETDPNGLQTIYSYIADDQLDQVTSHYGHSIRFSYIDGNVATVTDVFGAIYTYEYDTNNNMVSVIYPDTTLNDNTDNPSKIYHYENIDYPNHLTGITDELGNRYATYSYNSDGKATSTEHSQTTNVVGQEKFELDFQGGE